MHWSESGQLCQLFLEETIFIPTAIKQLVVIYPCIFKKKEKKLQDKENGILNE